ncbi:MAG: DNA-protecting protein DprA [Anaerolineales bacterium]|nr:MAG: DNA-protecting protein DprA [Anaerolineales bacterium]
MGDDLRYWIGFNRIHGVGAARFNLLLEAFGDLEYAWKATASELRNAGLGQKTVQSILSNRDKIDPARELDRVYELGYSLLTIKDRNYPARLREIDLPPPLLYQYGELVDNDRLAAAIVGTRRATQYGKSVAREIAYVLAGCGVTIVSGLARGIDGIAHQAAIDAGGRTIAVLGSGLDKIYPPEHRGLADQIAAQGSIVSDYALGTKPEGRNFPPRNRIISGLSLAVIVIEAGESSGALITADFSADQGRDVFAVPGDIYKPSSKGTNRLIQAGAHPLVKPEEVLEVLNLDLVSSQDDVSEQLPEDEVEQKVFKELSKQPIHVDELLTRCSLPASTINAALAMLELKGRVRQVGGMNFVRIREGQAIYKVD